MPLYAKNKLTIYLVILDLNTNINADFLSVLVVHIQWHFLIFLIIC